MHSSLLRRIIRFSGQWWFALWLAMPMLSVLAADSKSVDPRTLPSPKRVLVPKLEGSIKMDGELDEPVWKKAAALAPFFHSDGSGRERGNTEIRLWYDDQALYLAWICHDSEIQATFTARDSKFWEEEVAEFFVTPKELTRYYELQWNPLGGVFDAIIENEVDERGVSKRFEGEWGYTATGMKSAVKVKGTVGRPGDKDELWQVEVSVPFSDLNQPAPKPGEVWRANFYRFNRATGQPAELLSWSPTYLPGFHQPARFGYLEFGEGSIRSSGAAEK
jgi:hypothetical protein